MAKREDWVYDELICFLGNPLFQVPIITFMEEKCLVFDPSEEDNAEYKKLHGEYTIIIGKLLDAFMKDTGLSHNDVIKALKDMNSKTDLREIFQALFEQVLAMDDYQIFVRLMTQKNIELQQQALTMIMQCQGSLPNSLKDEGKKSESQPSQNFQQSEEEVLKAVLEQSKREYEEEQKKKNAEKSKQMESIIQISQAEHTRLEEERLQEKQKLDMALQSLSIQEASQKKAEAKPAAAAAVASKPPPSKPVSQTDLKSAPSISVTPAPAPAPAPVKAPVAAAAGATMATTTTSQKLPAVSGQKPQVSSADAAANWMKQAHEESSVSRSSAVSAAAAQMSNLSQDEIKKRQAYLKEQRDKLLEMKRKEREKQLLAAESSQPKRPMSARAARSALENSGANSGQEKKLSPEEEKKLAMRKAIADRLKAEMLGDK